MDNIIAAIQGSETPDQIQRLKDKGFKDIRAHLAKNRAHIIASCQALDPARHTYGFATILGFVAESRDIYEREEFLLQAKKLLMLASIHQIDLCIDSFGHVARRFGEMMQATRPEAAIFPLQRAVVLLRKGNMQKLTAAHAGFMLCCIKAKMYEVALPTASVDLLEVQKNQTSTGPVSERDNLLYHYYAGIVFTAFKQRRKAIDCFQIALCAPGDSLSAIQVEAYKRYVLLSLIVFGELQELPRWTSPTVSSSVTRLCGPYNDLVEAHKKGLAAFETAMELHAENFHHDGLVGLVKQVRAAVLQRQIRNLTNTYMTLSLADIAKEIRFEGPDAARTVEKRLFAMIEDGDIAARIDHEAGMVQFLDRSSAFATADSVRDLVERIRSVQTFWVKSRAFEHDISLDTGYIRKRLQDVDPGKRIVDPMAQQAQQAAAMHQGY